MLRDGVPISRPIDLILLLSRRSSVNLRLRVNNTEQTTQFLQSSGFNEPNLQTIPHKGARRVRLATHEKDPGNSVPKRGFVVITRGRRSMVTLGLREHSGYRR